MNQDIALTAFAVLANQTRQKTAKELINGGSEERSAREIAKSVRATPSHASFDLSALTDAGFGVPERAARIITDRMSFAQLVTLLTYVLEECCKSHPEVQACCALKPMKSRHS